jgi:hypothetical protein
MAMKGLFERNQLILPTSKVKIDPLRPYGMTKLGIFSFGLLLVMVIAVESCQKFEEFPPTPEIAFNDFTLLVDTAGVARKALLSISYRDGDGDIGLEQGDTLEPYQIGGDFYYNYIITMHELQNGVFVTMPFNFNVRIKPLLPKDQKKSIKGIIEDKIDIYDPTSTFDTIRFSVKLIDRALNVSNEVITPAFVRKVP